MSDDTATADFELLFYDHLVKEKPKLVNKVFSLQRRLELEKKRRSSGDFKPLKEVVLEYNKIVSRKRAAADSVVKSPVAKKAFMQSSSINSTDDSDSDNPIKQAATKLINHTSTKRPSVPESSSNSDVDIPTGQTNKFKLSPKISRKGEKSSDSESENDELNKKTGNSHPVAQSNNETSTSVDSSSSDTEDNSKILKKQLKEPAKSAKPAKSPAATSLVSSSSFDSSDSSNNEDKSAISQQVPKKSDYSSDSENSTSKTTRATEIQFSKPETTEIKSSPSSSDSSDSNGGIKSASLSVKKQIMKKPSVSSSSNSNVSKDTTGKFVQVTKLLHQSKPSVTKKANTSQSFKLATAEKSSLSDSSESDVDVKKPAQASMIKEKMMKSSTSNSSSVSSDSDDIHGQTVQLKRLDESSKPSVTEKLSSSSSDSSDSDINTKKPEAVKSLKSVQIAAQNNSSSTSLTTFDNTVRKTGKTVLSRKQTDARKECFLNSGDLKKGKAKDPLKLSAQTPSTILRKGAVSRDKHIESLSDDSSSSDDSTDNNLKQPTNKSVTARKQESSGSSSSSDDSADNNLRRSTNKSVTAQKQESSGTSSSSDDSTDNNLKLSTNKSVTAQKQESSGTSSSSDDSDKVFKPVIKTLSNASSNFGGKISSAKNLEGTSSDSNESSETPLKETQIQVEKEVGMTQETDGNLLNSSGNYVSKEVKRPKTNTQHEVTLSRNENSVDTVGGRLSKVCSSDLSGSGKFRRDLKIETAKVATKQITNDETSSSDSDSDDGKNQGDKTPHVVKKMFNEQKVTLPKVNSSSSSDSSVDSDVLIPSSTTTEKQPTKLQQQQKQVGKHKTKNEQLSSVFSKDVRIQKVTSKTGAVNSGVSTKKTPSISSSSSSDEAAVPLKKTTVKPLKNVEVAIKSSDSSPSEEGVAVMTKVSKTNSKQTNKKYLGNMNCNFANDNIKKMKGKDQKFSASMINSDSSDLSSSDADTASVKKNSSSVVNNIKDSNDESESNRSSMKKSEGDWKENPSILKNNEKNGKRESIISKKVGGNSDDSGKKLIEKQNTVGRENAGREKKYPKERFSRVRISKDDLDEKFRDNSYQAKSYDHWGKKAYEALKNVQGKGFRHEKTKKKRGTYSGGVIDTSSRSIKFESESD